MNKTAKIQRLTELKEELLLYKNARRAIITGAQSYSLGSRSVTKVNLRDLQREIDRLEDEIAAIESPKGRFKRVVPIDGR
jgi:hypothetical protein